MDACSRQASQTELVEVGVGEKEKKEKIWFSNKVRACGW